MNYLRCKCGKIESWNSYGFAKDCEGCEECNTTLAIDSSLHKKLQPHEFEIKYNTNTGKPYKVCKKCNTIDVESYKQSEILDNNDA